mgnify:CR=1 FL=1|jgi:hypothetical protein
MDLKQLLNNTKIVHDKIEKEVVKIPDIEEVNHGKYHGKYQEDEDEDEESVGQLEYIDQEVEILDPRFAKPWNKLEKGSKMNRILLFIEYEKVSKSLSDELTKLLKQLLFKGCESGLFNKLTDVTYNKETGIIESFKNLEFNESSKKYKLKTGSTKNRSVTKSRSNIDRLTKK